MNYEVDPRLEEVRELPIEVERKRAEEYAIISHTPEIADRFFWDTWRKAP